GRRVLPAVRRLECRALDEREREGLLVILKLRLPVAHSDDDLRGRALNLARVGDEVRALYGHGLARQVAEGCLVHLVDEVPRLLELDGEEERAADVDAVHLGARLVYAAAENFIRPEA